MKELSVLISNCACFLWAAKLRLVKPGIILAQKHKINGPGNPKSKLKTVNCLPCLIFAACIMFQQKD
jgi:hypothetical protein